MKNVNTTVLDNGIRVVSERLTQFESVALGCWIESGLANEPENLIGINHYLEHMLFKGTQRRTAQQISQEIDSVGGHLNGYTEREYICLYVHLLGENLPLGIDLLLDMLLHSRFEPQDIETEREVLIQESRRLVDNPEDYVHDLTVQTSWEKHPLGRSLHGSEESIGAVTRRNLLAYYRTNYTPQRLLIAAAGAVDHDLLVKQLEQATSNFRPRKYIREQQPISFHGEVKYFSRDSEQVHFCIALPGTGQTDKERYAQAICDTLLGGTTSSRLFQEIREKRGLVYTIGTYSIACRQGGLFIINAGTDAGNLSEVLDLIRQELINIQEKGVTEEELAWAKTYVAGSLALARESTSFRMQRLARSMLYEDKPISHKEILRHFNKVTAKDVQQIARRYFSVKPTVVAIGPVG